MGPLQHVVPGATIPVESFAQNAPPPGDQSLQNVSSSELLTLFLQTAAQPPDDFVNERLHQIGIAFLTFSNSGEAKLNDFTIRGLLELAHGFAHIENGNQDILQDVYQRLSEESYVNIDECISQFSPQEIVEYARSFSTSSYQISKDILLSFAVGLQAEATPSTSRFETLEFSEALNALSYFTSIPRGQALLTIFSRKFIQKGDSGNYLFNDWTMDHLSALLRIVSQYKDTNEALFDALFSEFSIPARMDSWIAHKDTHQAFLCLSMKGQQHTRAFFTRILQALSSGQEPISAEVASKFSASDLIQTLLLLLTYDGLNQEREFSQALQICQEAIYRRTNPDGDIEDKIELGLCPTYCEVGYLLSKRALLQPKFIEVLQLIDEKNMEQIASECSAKHAIACMMGASDFNNEIFIKDINLIVREIEGADDIAHKEELLPFELFLELFSNDQHNRILAGQSAFLGQFNELFFIYQEAKKEGRLVISGEQYVLLLRRAIDLDSHDEKLFSAIATSLQEQSLDLSLIVKQYSLDDIITIASRLEDDTLEPISICLQGELLRRKEEFLKIPPPTLAEAITVFGEMASANKALFSLFEEAVLLGGNAFLKPLSPEIFSEVIRTFLEAKYGSRELFTFFNSALSAVIHTVKPIINLMPFKEMCRLTSALIAEQRGAPELYKTIQEEFVLREKSGSLEKIEELEFLGSFVEALRKLGLSNALFFNAYTRLATRNHLAWLKGLPPEELAQMIPHLMHIKDVAVCKEIQKLFFRPRGQETQFFQALNWIDLASVVSLFSTRLKEENKQFLEAVEQEISANKTKLLSEAPCALFHFYMGFKSVTSLHFHASTSIEEAFLQVRGDGQKAIQSLSEQDLVKIYMFTMIDTAKKELFQAIIDELFARGGITGFHELCRKGVVQGAICLIEKGFDIRLCRIKETGRTALHSAVYYGLVDVVQLLLTKGVTVNAVDKQGYSALHLACTLGHMECAHKLLEHEADITQIGRFLKLNSFQLVLLSQVWETDKEKIKKFFLSFFGTFQPLYERIESHKSQDGYKGFISHFIRNPHLLLEGCASAVGEKKNPMEIAFLFHDYELACALFDRLSPKEALEFLDDLIKKYPKQNPKMILGALFTVFCSTKNEREAIRLLERGEIDLRFVDPKGNSFLHIAVRHDCKDIIQKLIEKKIDVNRGNEDGDTPLHIAILHSPSMRIFNLLVEAKACPIRLNKKGKSPFGQDGAKEKALALEAAPTLHTAFLLQDLQLAQEVISKLSLADFRGYVQAIKDKYPQSPTEFLECALYRVNQDHLRESVRSEIPLKPDGVELDELMPLFNEVNFTDPQKAHYYNPADFAFETGTTLLRDLSELIEVDVIKKIKTRRSYNGTPDAGTPALESFYSIIERATLHTIKHLRTTKEPLQRAKTIIEYLRAAKFCGGRIMNVALDRYDAVILGKEESFEKTVYELLGEFRKLLLDGLVPAGEQSVHVANKYFELLAEDLNLPNKQAAVTDRHAHLVEKTELRARFDSEYIPFSIITHCLSVHLEQDATLRDKCINWFKKRVPKDFDQARIEPIKAELAKFESRQAPRAEIVKYLREREIFVQDGSYADAIENDREQAYLGQEVVVDMNAEKMQIKKSAIFYALEQLGVIRKII